MAEFWRASGFHLLERNTDGWLGVTDEYLSAYFRRPEMAPVEESCEAERALHRLVVNDPKRDVSPAELEALADPDARDNWRVVLDFRDRLVTAGTVESCYTGLFRGGPITVPPLFIDQMAHVILRNILDGCDDPIRVRAAEMLFRTQKVSQPEGAIMMADEETVEFHAESGGFGDLGRLLAEAEAPMASVELDILSEANGPIYWERSERHDTVLDASFGRAGIDALCRVLEAWVRHFLSVEVSIQPVAHIRDKNWAWHIGLDAAASALLNDLYEGEDLVEDRLRRLLALFRLEFRDDAEMRADIAGRPVYLGLAMDGENVVRLKPQNLLINLPIATSA